MDHGGGKLMADNFDFDKLKPHDLKLFCDIVGAIRKPDLIIAPDGLPYLYRWHVIKEGGPAGVKLHIQVASDPERPLHNHPWDNTSVILAGGYRETLCWSEGEPDNHNTEVFDRHKGDVIFRRAGQSHRLELPYDYPYTMTLFMTGPRVRNWGFWYPTGFVPYEQVTVTKNGKSVHIKSGAMA